VTICHLAAFGSASIVLVTKRPFDDESREFVLVTRKPG
jgi:hypothetical protein